MANSDYKIGTTLLGIASLNQLSPTPIVDPKHVFQFYGSYEDLVDGQVRGVGSPVLEWRYGYVTRAQRDQFRTFCTGPSSTVFIRTRTNDSTDQFLIYQAIMIWPLEEDKRAGRRLDFTIRFRNLIEQVEE